MDAGVRKLSNAYRIWVGRLEGKDHLEDAGLQEGIILERTLKK
jgi:hypothetical protein